MEEEELLALHKLFEAANPRSVKGDALTKAISELYASADKNFDKLYNRNFGSRVFQLLFRRGGDEIRGKLLTKFKPILLDVAKSKYSYYIVISMIKNGNEEQRHRVFDILKGNFDKLLGHRIGYKVLDTLFSYTNQQQKNLMYLDFYGPKWKNQNKLLTLEEICQQGDTVKNSAIKTLSGFLRQAIDKDGSFGEMKFTQRLLMILAKNQPSEIAHFAVDFSKFSFSYEGSQVAIIAMQNAAPNEIKTALKLLEPNIRKPVIPGLAQPQQEENNAQANEEEEEEEEDAEDQGEEEAVNEEGDEATNEDEYSANITTQMAMDQFAWRALCAAISYNTDINVMKDEVIPNLMEYWEYIKDNKNALKLMLRLISKQPSVFHDLQFQKGEPDPELVSFLMPQLTKKVLTSISSLGATPDGSKLVATMMKMLVNDSQFARFAEVVFTPENIVDKILHKLIRSCIQIVGSEASKLALDTVHQVGIGEVLKTPGAWVIKELIPGNKKLESQVKSAIKKEKIEGKAIESILHPKQQQDIKPKKRVSKPANRK